MRIPKRLALTVPVAVFLLWLVVYAKVLPLVGAVLAVLIVPWLIVLAARKTLGAVPIHEGVAAVLSALGAGVVLFWVLQGALSSRLQIEVSGDGYKLNASQTLVVASVKVSNVGGNDVSVESAKLTITPKRNNAKVGDTETILKEEIGFDRDRPDPYAVIADETEYCFAWNTVKTAQVSRVLPEADYYEIHFEMYTHHRITRALATWRGRAVVPLRTADGSSPGWSGKDDEVAAGTVPETIVKILKGG